MYLVTYYSLQMNHPGWKFMFLVTGFTFTVYIYTGMFIESTYFVGISFEMNTFMSLRLVNSIKSHD
jgi:hypothetical protein